MQVVTYDQVEDKRHIAMLLHIAFGGATDPREVEERRPRDYLLRDTPVGFAALEDGRPVGFVGVIHIPTRTAWGPQTVGGIWGVVTDPACSGRGIARILMEEAHRYLKERGFPFVFLTTNRTWAAYRLYRRLGYSDVPAVEAFPRALGLVPRRGTPEGTPIDLDIPRALEVFRRATEGRTGFVECHDSFLSLPRIREQLDLARSVQTDEAYALVSHRRGFVFVEEAVGTSAVALRELVEALEMRAEAGLVDRLIPLPHLEQVYRERGYIINPSAYYTLMVAPLQSEVAFDEAYPDFYISHLQYF